MKRLWIEILFLYLMSTTLCIATRYDCDRRDISCGCGFKNVNFDEDRDHPVEAIPYSWSMMASIRYDCDGNGDPTTHCCVGTILNDRYILTTARCLQSLNQSTLLSGNMTIAAGIHRLSQVCPSVRVVDQWVIHPDWTSSNEVMHDIALLRLAEPLDFYTDFIIRKACFPFPMSRSLEMTNGTDLVAVGWDALNQSGEDTDKVLQQVIVQPINSNDTSCATLVTDDQLFICVGRYGNRSNLSRSSFRMSFFDSLAVFRSVFISFISCNQCCPVPLDR